MTGLQLAAQGSDNQFWNRSVTTHTGDPYAYRLTYSQMAETSKNVVLFDSIEDIAGNAWTGSLASIDLSDAKAKGLSVKVYTNTANIDSVKYVQDNIAGDELAAGYDGWTLLTECNPDDPDSYLISGDLSAVKSVAFDFGEQEFAKDQEGKPSVVQVYLRMKAPHTGLANGSNAIQNRAFYSDILIGSGEARSVMANMVTVDLDTTVSVSMSKTVAVGWADAPEGDYTGFSITTYFDTTPSKIGQESAVMDLDQAALIGTFEYGDSITVTDEMRNGGNLVMFARQVAGSSGGGGGGGPVGPVDPPDVPDPVDPVDPDVPDVEHSDGLVLSSVDVTYDGQPHFVTAYPGSLYSDAAELTITYTDANGNSVDVPVDAGTYSVSGVISESGTYSTAISTVVIHKAPLRVTTASASKSYDGSPLTRNEGSVSGLQNGETVSFSVTGKQSGIGSSENTYELVWNGTAKASNYTVSESLGVLSVFADPGIDIPDPTPALTIRFSGLPMSIGTGAGEWVTTQDPETGKLTIDKSGKPADDFKYHYTLRYDMSDPGEGKYEMVQNVVLYDNLESGTGSRYAGRLDGISITGRSYVSSGIADLASIADDRSVVSLADADFWNNVSVYISSTKLAPDIDLPDALVQVTGRDDWTQTDVNLTDVSKDTIMAIAVCLPELSTWHSTNSESVFEGPAYVQVDLNMTHAGRSGLTGNDRILKNGFTIGYVPEGTDEFVVESKPDLTEIEVVYKSAAIILPVTGGSGTGVLCVMGLVFLIPAAFVLAGTKRKKHVENAG